MNASSTPFSNAAPTTSSTADDDAASAATTNNAEHDVVVALKDVVAVLGTSGLDARSPQLIGDETEHEESGRDERLADVADPPSPVHRGLRAVPFAEAAPTRQARRFHRSAGAT